MSGGRGILTRRVVALNYLTHSPHAGAANLNPEPVSSDPAP